MTTVDRADEPAALYVGARWQVMLRPTRRLLRLERSYRADATSGRTLDRTGRAAWAATRDELRQRGRRLPPVEQRPRSWHR